MATSERTRPEVLSVQVGQAQEWDSRKHHTGIDKQPISHLDVHDPGPREEGGRSGVAGDFIGDLVHHGGREQAVYLFAREELDHWQRDLGRSLAPGSFGENITTAGLDVDAALIGTRWRIGTAVLEVTGPRIPCRTFAWALDEKGWVKRFTQRARSGAYTAVVQPGRIAAGDEIGLERLPEHDISVIDVFGAFTTDRKALRRVVDARVVPARYQRDLEAKLR